MTLCKWLLSESGRLDAVQSLPFKPQTFQLEQSRLVQFRL